MDPPQGGDFKPLSGDLFPTKYPLTNPDSIRNKGLSSYFFKKYYITQRLFFSFAKQAQYCNFEVMVNALKQNIIDLSQAEIMLLKTSESSPKEFEEFIMKQHKLSKY